MSIDAGLQAFRDYLGDALGTGVALVVRLQDAPPDGRPLAVWPWRIEDVVSRETIPRRPDPDGEPPSLAVPRSRVHLLVLGDDLALLSRARDALHRNPVLRVEDRGLRVHFSPLTVDQACALFQASGAPMQAALSLTLEG